MRSTTIGTLLLAGTISLPLDAAETSSEGTIIVVRDLPPRVAYREAPPGPVRLEVSTSPEPHVLSALGLNAGDGGYVGRTLSESEFSAVSASLPGGVGGMEEGLPGLSYLTGPLSAGSQGQAAAGPMPAAVAGALGRVGGTVTRATGTVNPAIQGATNSANAIGGAVDRSLAVTGNR